MDTDQRELEYALAALAANYQIVEAGEALTMMRTARNTSAELIDLILESVSESDLLPIVAQELGFPYLDMHAAAAELVVDPAHIKRCDEKVLQTRSVLPLVTPDNKVVVAMANPTDLDANNYIRSRFPEGYTVALSPKKQITSKLYQITDDFEAVSQANAVPEFVEYIFKRSVAEGASDIHFRTLINDRLQIRFRIDGVLREMSYPEILIGRENEVCASLLAKCPTIDSSNMRDTQDGTFTFEAAGRKVDVRVAMLPLISGPNITCRLLDPNNLKLRLEDMGFDAAKLGQIRDAASSSQGALLVVGPTGSGKSTTLYTLLGEQDPNEKNIITLEDPVEYKIMGIAQTQIRSSGDRPLTFAKVLRNCLRQDPDLLLIGEMRDLETAKTGMEAAMTGHMVFSTLHANTAVGAYMRLVEMGLEPFIVSEAVTLIISQRLMRRVHSCAEMGAPSDAERSQLNAWGFPDVLQVPKPMGCSVCNGTGYKGRIAGTEVLQPDRALKAAISRGDESEEILAAAWSAGWRPIVHDGVRHLQDGKTTVAEIARVIAVDDFVYDPESSGRSEEASAQ